MTSAVGKKEIHDSSRDVMVDEIVLDVYRRQCNNRQENIVKILFEVYIFFHVSLYLIYSHFTFVIYLISN